MKIRSKILPLFLAVGMLSFTACSEDDADDLLGDAVPCGDYVDELDDLSAASQAFSNNPTPATCDAYKTAYLNFFNEYRDCPFFEGSDYQDLVDDIESLDCSQYE